MEIDTIGIDLGKTVFHLVGLSPRGEIVVRKKLSRTQLLHFTANLRVRLIGMESCGGAHFLGRALRKQGHDVRLIPAQYVKPYVKTNKNDYIDAEAIAEAVGRPKMRFVPIKSDDQLDMQSLHRVRDRWVGRRTSLINQIRGLLLERGITVRQGRRWLEAALPGILEDPDARLSGPMRMLLAQLQGELKQLQIQIEEVDEVIVKNAGEHDACRRLMAIPGIGPLTATAVVAAIGNGVAFSKGRNFATWLGLVPGQYSTGGKQKLLGISKRGNSYLRRLFVHGARAVLCRAEKQSSGLRAWLTQLAARAHRNVVAVALANKLARVAWAVLSTGEVYRPPLLTADAGSGSTSELVCN
jgi:transposase